MTRIRIFDKFLEFLISIRNFVFNKKTRPVKLNDCDLV